MVLLAVLALGLALIRFRVDLATPDGWRLQPQAFHPYPLLRLLPAVLVAVVCGVTTWLLVRRRPERPELSRGRAAGAVALLWLGSLGLQLTCEWGATPQAWLHNAVAATWIDVSNGYFTAATEIGDLPAFIRDYHEIQRNNTKKLGTHPPGAVIAYWLGLRVWRALPGLQRAMDKLVDRLSPDGGLVAVYIDVRSVPRAPDLSASLVGATLWCLLLFGVVGASAVVPTYLLGAAGGDRRVGVLAAALLALAPSSCFYLLSLDPTLMTCGAWGLAGAVVALHGDRARLWPAFGGGLALGVMLLISLGALPAVAVAAAYVLLRARRGTAMGGEAAKVLGAGLLGILTLLALATAAGLRTGQVFVECLAMHREGPGGIGYRAYWPWLWFNLIDHGLFLGLPIVAVLLDGLTSRDGPGEAPFCLGWAALAVLLLLDLTGTVRAETERLWMFFNPALVASAAAAAAGRAERVWPLACQPLQLLLMALSLPPLVRPF